VDLGGGEGAGRTFDQEKYLTEEFKRFNLLLQFLIREKLDFHPIKGITCSVAKELTILKRRVGKVLYRSREETEALHRQSTWVHLP